MGQRCFPNPVISNDEGTERLPYVPTGREIVGKCKDADGKEVDGLTYEGELNKVGTRPLFLCGHTRCGMRNTISPVFIRRSLTPSSARPAKNLDRVFEFQYMGGLRTSKSPLCLKSKHGLI